MNKKTIPFIGICILAAIAAGCAKEQSTDKAAAAKTYFESWVKAHHPDAERVGDGIYILHQEGGEGDALDADTEPFAFVQYQVTDLEGNVSSTNIESVAKRVGTYRASSYYGDWIWWVTDTPLGVNAGVEQMLDGMQVGETRTAAIPYWLLTTNRYDSEATYMEKVTTGSNAIYTVTLKGMTDDIKQYEADLLDAYSKEHLGGIDSTYYAGDEQNFKFGFYYKPLNASDVKMDYVMPSDTTMYLNYTGYLLDGKVFDTTIADVAKQHHIYNASRSYTPVKITRASKYTDIAMGESSDLCAGFQAAIAMMHPMEKGTTLFWSGLGYSYGGSGSAIPPYAPLRFDLELVEQPE